MIETTRSTTKPTASARGKVNIQEKKAATNPNNTEVVSQMGVFTNDKSI